MSVEFHLKEYLEAPVRIELNRLEIIVLVGEIILSLKHPRNTGPSTVMARDLARSLVEKLKIGGALPIDGNVRDE